MVREAIHPAADVAKPGAWECWQRLITRRQLPTCGEGGVGGGRSSSCWVVDCNSARGIAGPLPWGSPTWQAPPDIHRLPDAGEALAHALRKHPGGVRTGHTNGGAVAQPTGAATLLVWRHTPPHPWVCAVAARA